MKEIYEFNLNKLLTSLPEKLSKQHTQFLKGIHREEETIEDIYVLASTVLGSMLKMAKYVSEMQVNIFVQIARSYNLALRVSFKIFT